MITGLLHYDPNCKMVELYRGLHRLRVTVREFHPTVGIMIISAPAGTIQKLHALPGVWVFRTELLNSSSGGRH